MKEIKVEEKFLEIKKILEASLWPVKENIPHVAYVKRQVTWKKIVGIMENLNVSTARNLAT